MTFASIIPYPLIVDYPPDKQFLLKRVSPKLHQEDGYHARNTSDKRASNGRKRVINGELGFRSSYLRYRNLQSHKSKDRENRDKEQIFLCHELIKVFHGNLGRLMK